MQEHIRELIISAQKQHLIDVCMIAKSLGLSQEQTMDAIRNPGQASLQLQKAIYLLTEGAHQAGVPLEETLQSFEECYKSASESMDDDAHTAARILAEQELAGKHFGTVLLPDAPGTDRDL